jgi:hypothetical protein
MILSKLTRAETFRGAMRLDVQGSSLSNMALQRIPQESLIHRYSTKNIQRQRSQTGTVRGSSALETDAVSGHGDETRSPVEGGCQKFAIPFLLPERNAHDHFHQCAATSTRASLSSKA